MATNVQVTKASYVAPVVIGLLLLLGVVWTIVSLNTTPTARYDRTMDITDEYSSRDTGAGAISGVGRGNEPITSPNSRTGIDPHNSHENTSLPKGPAR